MGQFTGVPSHFLSGKAVIGASLTAAAPPVNTLALQITHDFIAGGDPNTPKAGLLLSQLMTPTQITQYQAGHFASVTIVAANLPGPNAYWVLAGFGEDPNLDIGSPGFVIDLDTPSGIAIHFDSSHVRSYGTGASGGNAGSEAGDGAFSGGDAIQIRTATPVTLTIDLGTGANQGRIYAGGGAGAGSENDPGGGGAAGWFAGVGGNELGGGASPPNYNGGVYDPENGGTGLVTVSGGVPSADGGPGGGLGQDGSPSGDPLGGDFGVAGLAVNRVNAAPGVTTVLNGSASDVRGVVM